MRVTARMNDRTREHALLFHGVRTRPSDADASRIRTLCATALDWNYILGIANGHGVWPVLLFNLKAAGAAVPIAVSDRLEQQFVQTTARNLSLTAQLAQVMRMLETRGIPVVALKGPAFTVSAYGQVGLRSFVDLDVLVPREAIHDARDVMLANGYSISNTYHHIFDGVYPPAGREDVFEPADRSFAVVEVQVTVASWVLPVRLETRGLIERAVTVVAGGTPLRTLCAEDVLLTLAIHGTRHFWNSIRHIAEVDAALHADLGWPAVLDRARSSRMQRMLAVALLLAHELLDSPIPDIAVDFARRDRQAARLASQIVPRIFAPVAPRYEQVWHDRVSIGSREHVMDKLRYGVRKIAYERFIRRWDGWTHRGRRARAVKASG